MAGKRTYQVEVAERVYRTTYYRVEAENPTEAKEMVSNGYGEFWDAEEYDSEITDIDSAECLDCNNTDDDCECSSDVFEELGL